jgi:hypothetical protein
LSKCKRLAPRFNLPSIGRITVQEILGAHS